MRGPQKRTGRSACATKIFTNLPRSREVLVKIVRDPAS